MENILLKAHEESNKIDVGITWEQLRSNKLLHKNIYFDKFGFSWKVKDNVLMYSDSKYNSKRKHWEYANMEGCDIPYIKLLTLEEFEANKPNWI